MTTQLTQLKVILAHVEKAMTLPLTKHEPLAKAHLNAAKVQLKVLIEKARS